MRRPVPIVVLLAIAALAAAIALPTSAAARAYQLTTDPGANFPDIAVDEAGTAHVVWTSNGPEFEDDVLVYCRVPRGARSCESSQTFALPGSIGHPWVNILDNGEIVLTSERCCFAGDRLIAFRSADGGATFSGPQLIAETFWGWGEQVEPGPGDFSLSAAGGGGGCNDGVNYSAIPLDGLTTTGAAITPSCFEGEFDVSIGFPDPLTPLVAFGDWETDHILFRRWSGSGSYNDSASWAPVTQVPGPGGIEPRLASGVRGVFLIYKDLKHPAAQMHVRRYDGANFPGSSDRVVSDPKPGGEAIFRDLYEDGGGNLHAVFLQDDETGRRALRQSTSTDGGKRWTLESLARGDVTEAMYHLRVGAAPDGGGAVVADGNDQGPIWFAPFSPLGGSGGGSCRATVKLGGATAQALQGCFKKDGSSWVAHGPVKLNGIDIDPAGGGAGKASAAAAFHLTATPGQRRLTSSGPAAVHAGNVLLDKGPVDWKLPAGNGKVVRLGAADGSVFPDLGKFAKKLFEFPVQGDAELIIAGKGTKIPAHLRMPGLIGAVSGDTTLRTGPSGIKFGGIKIDVPQAAIGSGLAALRLAGIDVTYDGQNRFTGTARISLPPAYASSIAEVEFGFEDGELSLLRVTPPPFEPTLPIVGAPPSPIVGLDRVSFAYLRQPGSHVFEGDVYLLAGPKPAGLRAVSVDGAIKLKFPASAPTSLSATGTLKVVGLSLGSAYATYTLPADFKFGGGFEVLGVGGHVSGHLDLVHKTFSASGTATVGPFSGEAWITDSGFGACVPIAFPAPDVGISWDWGDPFPSLGCPGSGPLGIGLSGPGSRPRASAFASAVAAGSSIRATVSGSGHRRSLHFHLPRRVGQQVTFAEQSNRVYREIGSTRKGSGTFHFRPAPGPGGKREIIAIVEQDGIPDGMPLVARYKAPRDRRPQPPRRVQARRRGGKLVVAWEKVKGVRGYEVRVNLPRDGRRLLFFPAPGKHRLRIRGLERSDKAKVSVAAIGADLRAGRAARAKLAPAKSRRHRGKRRGGRHGR